MMIFSDSFRLSTNIEFPFKICSSRGPSPSTCVRVSRLHRDLIVVESNHVHGFTVRLQHPRWDDQLWNFNQKYRLPSRLCNCCGSCPPSGFKDSETIRLFLVMPGFIICSAPNRTVTLSNSDHAGTTLVFPSRQNTIAVSPAVTHPVLLPCVSS